MVAIVSDHGFLAVSRELNLGVALRRSGLITFAADTAPNPRSWTAAAWTAGGTIALMVKDTADIALRDRVGALLDSLASDTANGIAAVLDGDSLRVLGGFPGAAYLVSLRAGFMAGWRTTGPLVTPSTQRGAHGYLPDVPEMRASFSSPGPECLSAARSARSTCGTSRRRWRDSSASGWRTRKAATCSAPGSRGSPRSSPTHRIRLLIAFIRRCCASPPAHRFPPNGIAVARGEIASPRTRTVRARRAGPFCRGRNALLPTISRRAAALPRSPPRDRIAA